MGLEQVHDGGQIACWSFWGPRANAFDTMQAFTNTSLMIVRGAFAVEGQLGVPGYCAVNNGCVLFGEFVEACRTLLKQVEMNWDRLEWVRPASDMHAKLTLGFDLRIAKSASWPKTPAMFGNELRRLAPTLAENVLLVIFTRTEKQRLMILTTRPERHLVDAAIETQIPGAIRLGG